MIAANVFWFTGLSGAGKTTVAEGVQECLCKKGYRVVILDGDDVRTRLHRKLGFSPSEIKENNALIAEMCLKYRDTRDVILVPIISPYTESRHKAKAVISPGFYEIYFCAGLDVVSSRDPKGLYEKARRGEMDNLIGFSENSPYEPPENPDLVIDSGKLSPEQAINHLCDFIYAKTQQGKTPKSHGDNPSTAN